VEVGVGVGVSNRVNVRRGRAARELTLKKWTAPSAEPSSISRSPSPSTSANAGCLLHPDETPHMIVHGSQFEDGRTSWKGFAAPGTWTKPRFSPKHVASERCAQNATARSLIISSSSTSSHVSHASPRFALRGVHAMHATSSRASSPPARTIESSPSRQHKTATRPQPTATRPPPKVGHNFRDGVAKMRAYRHKMAMVFRHQGWRKWRTSALAFR
jgi:hypothetical protein